MSGLLSGLLGIGGGVIMVPAFVQFARMHVKAAIATSLACVGAFAVPGHDHPRAARATSTGGSRPRSSSASSRAPASARCSTIRATDRRLRVTVGTFLGFTAVLYAAGELNALTRLSGSRSPSSSRARQIASSIGSVSVPVKVFCWLTW